MDARAYLLEGHGQCQDALQILLHSLNDVGSAIRLVESAPDALAPDLWDLVVHAASSDQRLFSLLLVHLIAQPCSKLGGGLANILRRIPVGLEIPRLAAKVAGGLDDLE